MPRMLQELKAKTNEYHTLGCNIVPLTDKKPLCEWQKWQFQRQTRQEFEGLPWSTANQYAIICGTKLDNGFYLAVLDHDVKNLPPDTIDKGKQVLKHVPITQLEETPSGGLHYVYYCTNEPKSVSSYHNVCALELIGKGKICIMSPSQGYKNLNDNSPTTVQDIESLFAEALAHTGIKTREDKKDVWFDREDLAASAFKGDHPLCVHELLKGAAEGQRNEYAIRLSSYLVNFRRIEPTKAYKRLREWNKFNTQPLSNEELKNIFDSAIKGKYVFGCDDDILKNLCKTKAECPLRKKQQQADIGRTTYDPETEKEIESELKKILDAENQLDALKPHLDNMIVGEDNTKKSLVVLSLSAKIPDPTSKQIIILKATEGSGKSTIMRNAIQGYKVKNVGRFSAHALDYSNLEGYEILSLKELGSMDTEKQGVSTIKFLSSDDQGYTVEITAKDENTGKFTTEQYKIPPITVVSSTTRLILDAQFERRAWPLGLDETPAQTRRIADWHAKHEHEKSEKLLGLRKLTEYEFSSAVYSRFVEKFQPSNVIIPFPKQLVQLLGFDVLRVRGDISKLLVFVKLYGLLNLKRLQKVKNDVYLLGPEVAVEALNIALEPLSTMLSRVDKRSSQLFAALNEIIHVVTVHSDQGSGQVEKEITYNRKGSKVDRKTREEIAVRIGKSEKTVRDFFNQLENSGYASSDRKSKSKSYTLLFDVSEIQKKVGGISNKLKSAESLMDEMRKEAQEWLKPLLEKITFAESTKESVQALICAPIAKTQDQKEMNTPPAEDGISRSSSEGFQLGLGKNVSEQRQNIKLPEPPKENSERSFLLACPYCKSLGKENLFVSDADLAGHVQAVHTDYVRS